MKRLVYLCCMLFALVFLAAAATAQTVVMNEVYSRGTAGDLDWIEIYNPTSAPIDISGFKIYDSGGRAGSKDKKLFLAGTIVAAKGFAFVVTDTASFTGDNSGFGLSSGGETVWMENAAGDLIDSIAFPAMPADTSWARVPDGAGTWMYTSPRTQGATNVMIKMNEIYSRGTSGNLDWIEIHNGSRSDIDISGYKIYDNGGYAGSKPKKEFPAGTVLPANGFTVVITDTASYTGDLSGFGLSSGGETVWLEDVTGLVIDSVIFPAMGVDTSWARVPDGSTVFMYRSPLTRGASNGTVSSAIPAGAAAEGFVLHQNYPNPFNPGTTVSCTLAARSMVSITVHDLLGCEVAILARGEMDAGLHTVRFDARNLPSGVYIVRLSTADASAMRTMLLAK